MYLIVLSVTGAKYSGGPIGACSFKDEDQLAREVPLVHVQACSLNMLLCPRRLPVVA